MIWFYRHQSGGLQTKDVARDLVDLAVLMDHLSGRFWMTKNFRYVHKNSQFNFANVELKYYISESFLIKNRPLCI